MNYFALINMVGCGGAGVSSYLHGNYIMAAVWTCYSVASLLLAFLG